MFFAKAGMRFFKPRPVQLFGEQIQWVETTRYLGWGGVTLDTRLTPSSNVDQVRKEAAQRPGVLGPLLKKSRSLAIGNGVLLYKQLIQPMMDYACPKCRFATRTHSLPISEP